MMEKICATCKNAKEFSYGPSPSGPDDGVNCTSERMARYLGQQEQLSEYGYMNLFRIEVLEEGAECPCWEAKE